MHMTITFLDHTPKDLFTCLVHGYCLLGIASYPFVKLKDLFTRLSYNNG